MTFRLNAPLVYLWILMAGGFAAKVRAAPVMVQDFEEGSALPSVWVVNIPNENASVQFSDNDPHEGKRCLKLHYHFVSIGNFQYLGVENKVKIPVPIHKLRFWLKGDNMKCSYGVRLSDSGGKTHQYGKNSGQGGIIDFAGWREVVIDLEIGHETWGGDKTSAIDYPITAITLCISQPTDHEKLLPVESDLYFDSMSVDSGKSTEETLGSQIAVVSPEYCSDVMGDTPIMLSAPGFIGLSAKCWKQGTGFGSDSTVATVSLDAKGRGSFVFPADAYPHGPVTIRISSDNGNLKDNCYLQLYNKGGVSWNEGMPMQPPPAASGMSQVFADDFTGPLSISSSDPNATYYDHKPPDGSQDFSAHTFRGRDTPQNPFTHVDSYLRIRASDKTHSSGLISSLKRDGTGITAKAPCYFECRFIGPNAIGTWPAFWLLTDKQPCDELDIIEAYGGEGPREPNAFDSYMITPHCWDQGEPGKAIEKAAFNGMHNPIRMGKFGIPSAWFETFHTYGVKITLTDTIYYCDNIEVGRHPTLPLSRQSSFYFLINLATGGGWPVDLSRYHGMADMYVDYVRVYAQTP
jgi:hypothetical protein